MAIKTNLQTGVVQTTVGTDWPGKAASAWITIFDWIMLSGDTFTINGVSFVEGVDFTAATNEAITAINLRNAINASVDPLLDDITATYESNHVIVSANTVGSAGNSYTLSYTPNGGISGAYLSSSTFKGGYDSEPVGSVPTDSIIIGSTSSAIDSSSTESVIISGHSNACVNGSSNSVIIGAYGTLLDNSTQAVIIGGENHSVSGQCWGPIIIGGDQNTIIEDEYSTILQSFQCRIQGNGTSTIIANSWNCDMTADGHWLATIISSENSSMTAGWSYSGIYSSSEARITDSADYALIFGGLNNEISGSDNYSCIFNGTGNKINSTYGYNAILCANNITLETNSYSVLAHGDQHIVNENWILINGRRGYCSTQYKNVQAGAGDSTPSRTQHGSTIAYLRCTGTGADSGIKSLPIERKLYTNIDSSVMVYGFVADVAIVQDGGVAGTVGDACYRRYEGAIKNIGGVTSLIGGVTETTIAEDAGATGWGISFTADDTNDELDFAITGKEADKNLRATITIKTTEVGS